jgi:hypothetical protein
LLHKLTRGIQSCEVAVALKNGIVNLPDNQRIECYRASQIKNEDGLEFRTFHSLRETREAILYRGTSGKVLSSDW